MTDKEKLDAIRAEIHRLVDVRGYDREMANDLFTFMDSLPNEPVSEELEDAVDEYAPDFSNSIASKAAVNAVRDAFKAGAQWQKVNLWKPADGDDLPDIDREVIALLDNGKVVFAHRPDPKGWDGKSIITGKIEHYTPETYGKGGWNIPNVKYWLDVELPKEMEL